MAYEDINGLPYAKISDLKPGQTVWLGEGFDCHDAGPVTLKARTEPKPPWDKWVNPSQLCFQCSAGEHSLDGQCDDEHGICVGIYASNPSERSEHGA